MKSRTLYGCCMAAAILLATSFAQAQVFFPDPFPYPSTLTPGAGFYSIPNEPGKSFHEARQNFLQEEAKIAAADIRKGAAYLKMEKAVAKKEMQDVIAASERDLEKLAQNVENGTVFQKGKPVVWRCRNCGYLHEGNGAPKVCPACAHPQAHFELLAENW